MRFTHHPREVCEGGWVFDDQRTYEQVDRWTKPSGFWLSVDDDWRRWCQGDGMDSWVDGIPVFEFDVDLDGVLHIATAEQLIEFHQEYVVPQNMARYNVDWKPLAEQHAGIIIAPYQWSLRLDMEVSWYYPWDCASACIWDASKLTLIGEVDEAGP